jgi:hypothetical protein
MPPQVLAALIAAMVFAVGVVASVLVARWQLQAAAEKLRADMDATRSKLHADA